VLQDQDVSVESAVCVYVVDQLKDLHPEGAIAFVYNNAEVI